MPWYAAFSAPFLARFATPPATRMPAPDIATGQDGARPAPGRPFGARGGKGSPVELRADTRARRAGKGGANRRVGGRGFFVLEKKSRSDSRFVSLISRDDARIHPSSFRGSDGAGPRESSRGVSRFLCFSFRSRFHDVCVFSHASRFEAKTKRAFRQPPRSRARRRGNTRTAATSDGLFVVHAPARFRALLRCDRWSRASLRAGARAHTASSPRTARGTQDRDGSLGEARTRGVREARSARPRGRREDADVCARRWFERSQVGDLAARAARSRARGTIAERDERPEDGARPRPCGLELRRAAGRRARTAPRPTGVRRGAARARGAGALLADAGAPTPAPPAAAGRAPKGASAAEAAGQTPRLSAASVCSARTSCTCTAPARRS